MSANKPQYDEKKTEVKNSANSISLFGFVPSLPFFSNLAVQVVFYDKMEILLLSEARVVTYVTMRDFWVSILLFFIISLTAQICLNNLFLIDVKEDITFLFQY